VGDDTGNHHTGRDVARHATFTSGWFLAMDVSWNCEDFGEKVPARPAQRHGHCQRNFYTRIWTTGLRISKLHAEWPSSHRPPPIRKQMSWGPRSARSMICSTEGQRPRGVTLWQSTALLNAKSAASARRPKSASPFLDRPLEADWSYLWIDATYMKVRQNVGTITVAVIVAVTGKRHG
jgi:hypothetical protein